MKKHDFNLMEVPAIGQNLLTIIKILKEEERFEANNLVEGTDLDQTSTMSESLEYFVNMRILETLASYALADEPRGFFKFMIGVIEDLVQSVNRKQTNILQYSSIHCSIKQILKTIYQKLIEIPFEGSSEF